MAQMRISYTAPNFCPGHIETLIFLIDGHIRTNRPTETWPTTTRIKFILRGEEWLTGHDIYINTGIKLIPVTIGEGPFGIIFCVTAYSSGDNFFLISSSLGLE